MDEVFRAIEAPNRRLLLDKLFEQDGQTLVELCAHLPGLTRCSRAQVPLAMAATMVPVRSL